MEFQALNTMISQHRGSPNETAKQGYALLCMNECAICAVVAVEHAGGRDLMNDQARLGAWLLETHHDPFASD